MIHCRNTKILRLDNYSFSNQHQLEEDYCLFVNNSSLWNKHNFHVVVPFLCCLESPVIKSVSKVLNKPLTNGMTQHKYFSFNSEEMNWSGVSIKYYMFVEILQKYNLQYSIIKFAQLYNYCCVISQLVADTEVAVCNTKNNWFGPSWSCWTVIRKCRVRIIDTNYDKYRGSNIAIQSIVSSVCLGQFIHRVF